jgi:hypothetical protein
LELYKLTSATGSSSSTVSATSGTVSKTSSSTTTGPTTTQTGWVYQGCYVDGLNGRDLPYQAADNEENTQEVCISTCAGLGYTIAGVEYGVQCFCGNALYNGAAPAANQADCNVACPGNAAEDCGAGNRLSLFSIGTPQIYQPPAVQTTGLPANWVYKGCLQSV